MKEVIHNIFAIIGVIAAIFLTWYLVCPEIEPNQFSIDLICVLSVLIENWLNNN